MANGGSMLDAIRQFDVWVGETPRVGLWLDSTKLTPDQSVDAVLAQWEETFVE